MIEKDAERLEPGNLADTALEEQIAHWAEVLDRWVQGIDLRLGREAAELPPAPDGFDAATGAET